MRVAVRRVLRRSRAPPATAVTWSAWTASTAALDGCCGTIEAVDAYHDAALVAVQGNLNGAGERGGMLRRWFPAAALRWAAPPLDGPSSSSAEALLDEIALGAPAAALCGLRALLRQSAASPRGAASACALLLDAVHLETHVTPLGIVSSAAALAPTPTQRQLLALLCDGSARGGSELVGALDAVASRCASAARAALGVPRPATFVVDVDVDVTTARPAYVRLAEGGAEGAAHVALSFSKAVTRLAPWVALEVRAASGGATETGAARRSPLLRRATCAAQRVGPLLLAGRGAWLLAVPGGASASMCEHYIDSRFRRVASRVAIRAVGTDVARLIALAQVSLFPVTFCANSANDLTCPPSSIVI